jgi:DNA segregation ATPase FtsK/SpoIIIE, S-DNA-T family
VLKNCSAWAICSSSLQAQASCFDCVSTGEQNFVTELVSLKPKDEEGNTPTAETLKKRDALYQSAVEIVVQEGRGSVSLLQRALGIGYGRAARLIDFMAEDGIVGHYAGSQAREVLISQEDWSRMKGGTGDEEAPMKPSKSRTAASVMASTPNKKRSNKVVPEPWEPEALDSEDADEEANESSHAQGDDHEDPFAETEDNVEFEDFGDDHRETA